MKLNPSQVDFNRLRTLLAVQKAGSVQGAARRLGITSSAVSQSLKRLEAELDIRLFQRIGNRLQVTEPGSVLAAIVERFAADLTTTITEVRSLRDEPHGTVRVGSPFEFGTSVLIPAMQAFDRFSRLSFRMTFGAPETLMHALISHDLELAFCDDGPFLKKYASLVVFEPVFTERLILACSKGFAARSLGDDHGFSHLTSLPHVDYVDDLSVISLWYRHHFGKTPTSLSLRFVAEHVHGILAAIRSGLGLGMVPEHLVTKELAAGSLVRVSGRRKPLTNDVVLVRLKDRVPTLGERMFADRIREGRTKRRR